MNFLSCQKPLEIYKHNRETNDALKERKVTAHHSPQPVYVQNSLRAVLKNSCRIILAGVHGLPAVLPLVRFHESVNMNTVVLEKYR